MNKPDSEILVQKISLVRKYIFEVCLSVLAACVSYLFFDNQRLNDKINDYLMEDRTKVTEALNNNTQAFKEFTSILNSKK